MFELFHLLLGVCIGAAITSSITFFAFNRLVDEIMDLHRAQKDVAISREQAFLNEFRCHMEAIREIVEELKEE